MFHFEVPSRVFFGLDSRVEVLPVLSAQGFRRLGVVIDSALVGQDIFKSFLERAIPEAGLEIRVRLDARSGIEPDYHYLDQSAIAFRGVALDAILGIGGGSAMDLAKGIAVLATNGGKGIDYRGLDLVPKPGLPVVVFPTTAGTGSEVTRTASFTDTTGMVKLGINGRHVAAWAGVLDPMLTLDCPLQPTLAAGLDALVHCVESFTATTSSPLSREMARAAFPLLFNGLPTVAKHPREVAARQQMMLGAYLAGLAMWNAAGGGPASGISYPLGVRHKVPHGFAGGLLLPQVVRLNVGRGYEGYAPLFALIDGTTPAPRGGASEAFAREVESLLPSIGAPADFGRWGVDAAAIPSLVEDTMRTRAANLSHNPVPFSRSDVSAVLSRVAAPLAAKAA